MQLESADSKQNAISISFSGEFLAHFLGDLKNASYFLKKTTFTQHAQAGFESKVKNQKNNIFKILKILLFEFLLFL